MGKSPVVKLETLVSAYTGQIRGKVRACMKNKDPNTTRAIHLEVLTSLSADVFITALLRFCARRGSPKRIRSDQGTNMIGANRELQRASAS